MAEDIAKLKKELAALKRQMAANALKAAKDAEDALERSRFGGKEFQPRNNFFEAAIPPLTNSGIKLPGGRTQPFFYSLGVDSTVPFVSLQGGGASQKVFSWGEMIEVLPGQTVIVKNESYMLGDIQINSGHDYAAKPERISLAVDVDITEEPVFDAVLRTYRPKFPADTRRCRRGYLKYQIETRLNQIDINFVGKPMKHSFPAVDLVTGQQTYTQTYSIIPFTLDGEAPMGYGSNDNLLTPMAFTDQTTWSLTTLILEVDPDFDPFINTLFMYVLEY